eukprot:Hpha_TRINITY_DN16252_c0_g15::TRINITY_DN16252_c0_g15_i1::g.14996::m.14996
MGAPHKVPKGVVTLSSLHREEGPARLRIGLFHEAHPHFVRLVPVPCERRLGAGAGEKVVDGNKLPPRILAQPHPEDPKLRYLLGPEQTVLHQCAVHRHRRHRSHKITVRQCTLVYVRRLNLVNKKLAGQTLVAEQFHGRRAFEGEHLHFTRRCLPPGLQRLIQGGKGEVDKRELLFLTQRCNLLTGSSLLDPGLLAQFLHGLKLLCVLFLRCARLLLLPLLRRRTRGDGLRRPGPFALHELLRLPRMDRQDPLFPLNSGNPQCVWGGAFKTVLHDKLLIHRCVLENQHLRAIFLGFLLQQQPVFHLLLLGHPAPFPVESFSSVWGGSIKYRN